LIDQIKIIGVAGAGTMGAGIAQVAAQSGFEVLLFDVNEEAVKKGLQIIGNNLQSAIEKKKISADEKKIILSKIKTTTNISVLKCDIIIEAIIEKLDVKQQLFQNLSAVNNEDCIFASNTSSIPITELAKEIPHPERIAGMHFFNPAHIMKLIEVVSGKLTGEKFAECIFQLALRFGKIPVRAKDSPGFIVNRIGKLFHTESLKILEEKIADAETIDALLENAGFKMGPFKLIDLIGVDANLNVTKSLYELFERNPKFRPSELQQKMVNEGLLGKKSGQGFYEY
jgi:3-hydroxybutyryl-CoA dehydrogenase